MKKTLLVTALLISVLTAGNIQWKSDLIFSHKYHHEEVEAECLTCHAGADTSRFGSDDLLPTMQTCYNCHDEDTECSVCHQQPDEPIILPRITEYSAKFNHKRHLAKNIPCTKCHAGVALAQTVTESTHLPQMALCMNCHHTPQTTAGCYKCHQRNENLEPANHLADWRHNHGMVSESGGQNCKSCHTEDYCTNCHQGDNLNNLAHPADFIITHSISYKMRESDCVSCHQGKQYCVECHTQVNFVVPADHHLSDWSTEGHAQAARNDYDTCTVCHPSGDLICSPCHN